LRHRRHARAAVSNGDAPPRPPVLTIASQINMRRRQFSPSRRRSHSAPPVLTIASYLFCAFARARDCQSAQFRRRAQRDNLTAMRTLLAFIACTIVGCSTNAPVDMDITSFRQVPDAERADAAAVVLANNQFACDLYAILASSDGNLAFSPFSISTVLAML